jgi:hypothetical protein
MQCSAPLPHARSFHTVRRGALLIYRVPCQPLLIPFIQIFLLHFVHVRACDIVLGRQGRFAPPSAVAFGQP